MNYMYRNTANGFIHIYINFVVLEW